MSIVYNRNVQGRCVQLELIEVDPEEVRLDPTNPRIGFSIQPLSATEAGDEACTLLLTSKEKRSAQASVPSVWRSAGVDLFATRQDCRRREPACSGDASGQKKRNPIMQACAGFRRGS